MSYVFLAGSVLLGAAGHLLTKDGVTRAGPSISAFIDPAVIIGVTCYFVSMALWLPFLASRPVAQAVPMAGITYVVVAVVAGLMKGEWLSWPQWGGVLLIVAGLFFLNKTTV